MQIRAVGELILSAGFLHSCRLLPSRNYCFIYKPFISARSFGVFAPWLHYWGTLVGSPVFLPIVGRAGCLPVFAMLFDAAFAMLLDRLAYFYPLSIGFGAELKAKLTLKSLKKGEVLVECGKRQRKVWFICKGHAKEVTPCEHLAKGRVSWFWFAGDFLFSYPGFFSQEPAVASIELVEDCELLEISYVDFAALRDGFAVMPLLVEKIRGYYELGRVQHASDLVDLSAKERYVKFYGAHKSLFMVTKQKEIASFLGIKDDGFHRYYRLLGL